MSLLWSDNPISLNRYITELKRTCRANQERVDQCEVELAKAEAALRSMTISLAKEKGRADRAEAALRSLGGYVRRSA